MHTPTVYRRVSKIDVYIHGSSGDYELLIGGKRDAARLTRRGKRDWAVDGAGSYPTMRLAAAIATNRAFYRMAKAVEAAA